VTSAAPWRHAAGLVVGRGGRILARMGDDHCESTLEDEANGELIVALRNLAPAIEELLDTVEHQKALIERLAARLRRVEAELYGP
jgi:hypothetical protein